MSLGFKGLNAGNGSSKINVVPTF